MVLTPEQERKLARLHNRATLYEVELVHRTTGERRLLCYTRRTRRGILDYIFSGDISRRAKLAEVCDAEKRGRFNLGETRAGVCARAWCAAAGAGAQGSRV